MKSIFEEFAHEIERARWRVASLERHAGEALIQADELLPSALQELAVAFEELRVAQEELLHQQSELDIAREQLEQRVRERTAELEAAAAHTRRALEQAGIDRQAAQQAVHDREVFMAMVAHELKAPLAAIIGYGQLLQRRIQAGDTLKSRDLRGLRTIVESAQQLTSLADLLQDTAQIEAGMLHINRAPCDLCALARETIESLRARNGSRTFQLRCKAEPLVIEGDLLRLRQVIQNLLQNAIKYSSKDSSIDVLVEQAGDQARLSVTDHGIGISESARKQIFERFYRADNAEQNQIGGMGIGLYIVKQIVSLHGGRVEVESRVGFGSTFTVWLPLPMGTAQLE